MPRGSASSTTLSVTRCGRCSGPRRRSGPSRAELSAEVEALVADLAAKDVVVRGTYDVSGLRADADLMIWWHAPSAEALQELGLADFDLGGFSLGARTVVQAVGEGLRPGKAVLAGMGLRGLQNWGRRQAFFRDAIANFDTSSRGDPHWLAIQFMKTMKVDRVAAGLVLGSFADMAGEWLEAFVMPTLVVCGSEDEDNGSAKELAEALPDAKFVEVPGTHMSSVTKAELGEEIARFLAA